MILYSCLANIDMLSKCFQGKVNYVLRPVLPAGCETNFGHCGSVGASDSVNLGGYGVELAFKNMEYKAMDDSAIKKGWNNWHAVECRLLLKVLYFECRSNFVFESRS